MQVKKILEQTEEVQPNDYYCAVRELQLFCVRLLRNRVLAALINKRRLRVAGTQDTAGQLYVDCRRPPVARTVLLAANGPKLCRSLHHIQRPCNRG